MLVDQHRDEIPAHPRHVRVDKQILELAHAHAGA
jgi:hypothetical protein